jgi:hypothetical protein
MTARFLNRVPQVRLLPGPPTDVVSCELASTHHGDARATPGATSDPRYRAVPGNPRPVTR